jgi:hypothetical protein
MTLGYMALYLSFQERTKANLGSWSSKESSTIALSGKNQSKPWVMELKRKFHNRRVLSMEYL